MKACGALGAEDTISGTVEAVSFDDTLKEIEDVIEGGLRKDRTIPVNLLHDLPNGVLCEECAILPSNVLKNTCEYISSPPKKAMKKARPIIVRSYFDSDRDEYNWGGPCEIVMEMPISRIEEEMYSRKGLFLLVINFRINRKEHPFLTFPMQEIKSL